MFDPNYVLGDRGKTRAVGRASANQYISMSYKSYKYESIIACGVCLLLVGCVYCLWNVSIACGMCLMLVE